MLAHINHRLYTSFTKLPGIHRTQSRLGRAYVRNAQNRRVHSSVEGTLERLLARKWMLETPATKAGQCLYLLRPPSPSLHNTSAELSESCR